jgi:stage III sporulation protein AG
METVLATTSTTTTTQNGTETVETPLVVNGKTVVLMEVYPKITGVLIVAQGAKNIAVLNKIQQAAVSLLDINVNQIEILTMK